MFQPANHGTRDKGDSVLWLLWAAMVFSVILYVVVAHLFGDEFRKAVDQELPISFLKEILYGISACLILLAFAVRRIMFPGIDSDYRTMSMRNKPVQIQKDIRGKYTAAMLISLALSEAVAIFGLVLFFLGDTLQTFYVFISISMVAMLLLRPKRAELERYAMAMEKKDHERHRG